jgi:hypothetical protein
MTNNMQRRAATAMIIALIPLLAVSVIIAQETSSETQAEGTRPTYTKTRQISPGIQPGTDDVPILLPTQPGQGPKTATSSSASLTRKTPLLPEGYVVAARRGRIVQEGSWHVVKLADEEGLPKARPMRILPNQKLALLESVLREVETSPVFVLSGRVTEFQDHNYLLVSVVEVEQMSSSPTTQPTGDRATTTRPTNSTDKLGRTAEPTADDIMKRLLEHRRRKALVLPGDMPVARTRPAGADDNDTEGRGQDAAQKRASSWPEQALLVDVVGRIIPAREGWLFVFDDPGQEAAREPIGLLPNRLLETAIEKSAGGSNSAVFVITGEITSYQGGSYLLLRKLLLRRDLGNFN